jgi:hypothetical protein
MATIGITIKPVKLASVPAYPTNSHRMAKTGFCGMGDFMNIAAMPIEKPTRSYKYP